MCLPEETKEDHQPSQAFVDGLRQCVKRQPNGRDDIDLDRVVALVGGDPQAAWAYTQFACRQAQTAPGFLSPAALVAEAYRLATDDDTLIQLVDRRRRDIERSGKAESPLRSSASDPGYVKAQAEPPA